MTAASVEQVPAVKPARGESPSADTRRIVVLDGLRFLAALAVVMHHFVGTGGWLGVAWGRPTVSIFHGAARIAAYGFLGVNLFFLISGFVICMSAWGRTPSGFVISRISRLFPAYWLGVLATATVLILHPAPVGRPGYSGVLSNLTMVQEPMGVSDIDGVYWTLWVELRFYLLMLAFLFVGLTYRRTVLFCFGWTVLSVIAGTPEGKSLALLAMPEYSPYFIAGVCLYLVHRYGSNLVLWGIIVLQWLFAQNEVALQTQSFGGVLGHGLKLWPAIVAVTFFFLLMSAVALGWFGWARWRFLTVAGAMSYPLYLLHQSIGWTAIYVLRKHISPVPLVVGLTASLVCLAWLVQRFVERPVGRLLRTRLTAAAASIKAADDGGPPGTPGHIHQQTWKRGS